MKTDKAGWRGQVFPDDGVINLHDLSFDFEDFFDRHGTDAMCEEEEKEFGSRVMGLFCKSFFEGKGDPAAIPPWVANYIAKAMFNVLGGVPWAQALPTPFDDPEDQHMYTEKGRRATDIYCAVKNGIASGEGNSSELLSKQAKVLNLSYESIRRDYYIVKKWIEGGGSRPEGFLKNYPDI